MQKLLTTPLETLALKVLKLENFPTLMATLRFMPRKSVAINILRSVVDAGSQVNSVKMCEQLLTFISPLIRDEEDTPQGNASDSGDGDDEDSSGDDFKTEQRLVSRLIALIEHADTDVVFQIYNLARKAFRKGGLRRIQFTLVSKYTQAFSIKTR